METKTTAGKEAVAEDISAHDKELRVGLNWSCREWQENNPGGDILDWIVGLPAVVHWVIRGEVKKKEIRLGTYIDVDVAPKATNN